MNFFKTLCILFFLVITRISFARQPKPKGINVEKLMKVENLFYYANKFPALFTGNAYTLFADNHTVNLYWKIRKGIVIKFIKYSTYGKVLIEENFNSLGIYSGLYLSKDEKGDTLSFGNYKDGKKIRKWKEP